MAIKFTQYLMPNGRREQVTIERPIEIEEKANKIIEEGYKFEIEMLMTGMISMTVEDGVNEPIAHRICPNGPMVPSFVDQLVLDAFLSIKAKKKK
jgi:hypothetical protein